MKKQQCRRIVKNELKLQRNGTEREKKESKNATTDALADCISFALEWYLNFMECLYASIANTYTQHYEFKLLLCNCSVSMGTLSVRLILCALDCLVAHFKAF